MRRISADDLKVDEQLPPNVPTSAGDEQASGARAPETSARLTKLGMDFAPLVSFDLNRLQVDLSVLDQRSASKILARSNYYDSSPAQYYLYRSSSI